MQESLKARNVLIASLVVFQFLVTAVDQLVLPYPFYQTLWFLFSAFLLIGFTYVVIVSDAASLETAEPSWSTKCAVILLTPLGIAMYLFRTRPFRRALAVLVGVAAAWAVTVLLGDLAGKQLFPASAVELSRQTEGG
ncbi:hypothetical protein [Ensifer sp. B1-9]|uniref:hypothetical protein n=1 Tax=Ensifer sp. B1-9 TaxID=3141455 RepID=UPI003D21BA59